MISFRDTKKEVNTDVPNVEKDLVTEKSKLSSEQSKLYWDSLFQNNASETKSSLVEDDLSEEEIFNEIFSKNENDFDFPYDISGANIETALQEFNDDVWTEKTIESKKESIDRFVNCIGKDILDLDEIPPVELFEGESYELGAYIYPANRIEVNQELLNDPSKLLNSLAHEMRHAYQHKRAILLETRLDYLYKYNFEHYIAPSSFFMLYQNQLVESEARAFANLFNQKGEA